MHFHEGIFRMKKKFFIFILCLSIVLCSCQKSNIDVIEESPISSNDSESVTSEVDFPKDEDGTILNNKEATLDDFYRLVFKEEIPVYDRSLNYDNWMDMYEGLIYHSGKLRFEIVGHLIYLDTDDIPELILYNKDTLTIFSFYQEGMAQDQEYILAYNEKNGKYITKCYEEEAIEICEFIQGEITVLSKIKCDTDGQYVVDNIGTFNEKEYKELCAHFDVENAIPLRREHGYSQLDLLYVLKTGHDSSYNHRYEVVYEDISWSEAQIKCKEKGGYLAVITTYDEKEKIKAEIEKTKCCVDECAALYIGCDGFSNGNCWYMSNGLRIPVGLGKVFVSTPQGVYKSEQYMNGIEELSSKQLDCGVFYCYFEEKENDNKLSFDRFLAPENLAEFYPEMSGKVGYIIEYDE